MKSFLLIIASILFFSSPLMAQEELMKFKESTTSDSLSVSYTTEGEKKYRSWVSVSVYEDLILNLKKSDLQNVRVFLENSYSKYQEWLSIAEANNVDELNRDIGSINVGESLGFIMSGWNFAFGESELKTKIILEDDKNVFAVIVPSRSSSSNQYITSDTGVLFFTNESDFNSFLAVFDENEVRKRVDAFNDVQSLFD